jgi:hypothetical protein
MRVLHRNRNQSVPPGRRTEYKSIPLGSGLRAPRLIVVQKRDTEKLTAACEAPSANVKAWAGDSGGIRQFDSYNERRKSSSEDDEADNKVR